MMPAESPSPFEALVQVVERLIGPNGCPWDQAQTIQSIRHSVLEEACEFLEAVHLDDNENMAEELGDLLFNVIFFAKLGEKEQRFSLEQVIHSIHEKLIRRHPHVFGSTKVQDAVDVLKNWEMIKAQEKRERTSILDGIPKELPSLARAQKMLKKIKKREPDFIRLPQVPVFSDEAELGQLLAALTLKASSLNIDAEQALSAFLTHVERDFRLQEEPSQ